jgi:Coenzyme PQQ synthesis protein D (PqqD)
MFFPDKFQIPKCVLSRTVGTETILLNLETSTYHSLNAVGGRFWALLQQGKDFDEAVVALQSEYDVEPEQLKADLQALCEELEGLQLLQRAA